MTKFENNTLEYGSNIMIEPKARKWINNYFRIKGKGFTIYDILKEAGFDITFPSRIYFDKYPKDDYELIYEYKNKKYNINLFSDGVIEIVKYEYDKEYDYLGERCSARYKIKNGFGGKTIFEIEDLEINETNYFKKNENGVVIEAPYKECDFSFCYQERYIGEKNIWAIRVEGWNSETFPYFIELRYFHYSRGNFFDVKVDVINQRLKHYFATIDDETSIMEIFEKLCEINSVTLNDLNNGTLDFSVTTPNNENSNGRFLSIKDGIIRITEKGKNVQLPLGKPVVRRRRRK